MPPRPQLVIQTDQAAIDARETYTVTDGTFVKGDVAIGPAEEEGRDAPSVLAVAGVALGRVAAAHGAALGLAHHQARASQVDLAVERLGRPAVAGRVIRLAQREAPLHSLLSSIAREQSDINDYNYYY